MVYTFPAQRAIIYDLFSVPVLHELGFMLPGLRHVECGLSGLARMQRLPILRDPKGLINKGSQAYVYSRFIFFISGSFSFE